MTSLIFDIETTGLTHRSKITVLSYLHSTSQTFHTHFLVPESADDDTFDQTLPQRAADTLPEEEYTDNYEFLGYPAESEYQLLDRAMRHITSLHAHGSENTLTGFNSNNFDLGTLRTRCAINDVEWMQPTFRSRDLFNAFRHQFNTTKADVTSLNKKWKRQFGEKIGADVDDDMLSDELSTALENATFHPEALDEFLDEHDLDQPTTQSNTLKDVYEMLDGSLELDDPFDSSQEAVEAFRNGHIAAIIKHNLIDLIMTDRVDDIVQEYVDESETTMYPV